MIIPWSTGSSGRVLSKFAHHRLFLKRQLSHRWIVRLLVSVYIYHSFLFGLGDFVLFAVVGVWFLLAASGKLPQIAIKLAELSTAHGICRWEICGGRFAMRRVDYSEIEIECGGAGEPPLLPRFSMAQRCRLLWEGDYNVVRLQVLEECNVGRVHWGKRAMVRCTVLLTTSNWQLSQPSVELFYDIPNGIIFAPT